MKKTITLILLLLSIFNNKSIAQRGNPNRQNNAVKVHQKNHQKRVVVVKNRNVHPRMVVRSKYRPKSVIVYHPFWAPKRNYNRRWVYFPGYNFYWDNWRQMYVYRNNAMWIYNSNPPQVVVNVNLETEKHFELKEEDDDIDDVYSINNVHQTEYKLK